MQCELPINGSAALLEELSEFVPDAFISELLPKHVGRGKRRHWSSANQTVAATTHDAEPNVFGIGSQILGGFSKSNKTPHFTAHRETNIQTPSVRPQNHPLFCGSTSCHVTCLGDRRILKRRLISKRIL